MKDYPIILFDGICNFCNSSVNFVIKNDKSGRIRFASLQSEQGQDLLRHHQLPTTEYTTFIFIEKGEVYSRSTAALKVATYLRHWWPAFYGFIIVPRSIRDGVYNFIARNRYQWFGKSAACMIPGPDVKQRFL
jgi:predicted DCC family thiol-disulfide oxidoreductase YuxK